VKRKKGGEEEMGDDFEREFNEGKDPESGQVERLM
jgi:hypothetical protein